MQYSLLGLLAVANTERLDPKPLISALAVEHRGSYRRRLQLLSNRLNANTSLVSALEKTPDVLSDSVVLALRFGSQSGTLAQTYEQLLESERPIESQVLSEGKNAFYYWIVLASIIMISVPWLMYFIAPRLKKCFDEFDLQLPRAFRSLLIFWDFISSYALAILVSCLALAWLIRSSNSRRFFRRRIVGQLYKQNTLSGTAQLFQMLSIAVESGRPIEGSLSTLAKYHFDKNMRQRLLVARNEVEQGVPAWESLADAKLISNNEFQALSKASTNRIQAWTLRQLAAAKLNTATQRSLLRTVVLHPLVILFFASIVLWICFAFFSVLTQLISSLTGA